MTPAEIAASIRGPRSKRPAREHDRFSKEQLWAEIQKLRAQVESAASKANDLGRDLRQLGASPLPVARHQLIDASNRAYAVRDIARGQKPLARCPVCEDSACETRSSECGK